MKTCVTCKEEKEVEEFICRKSRKQFSTKCKDCTNKWRKEWRKKNNYDKLYVDKKSEPCVYEIINLTLSKRYIGVTHWFEERVSHHKSELNRRRHPNKNLLRDWIKYGEDDFEFVKINNYSNMLKAKEVEAIIIKRDLDSLYNIEVPS